MPLNITFKLSEAEGRRYHRASSLSQYPSVEARFSRHYESPKDVDSILVTGIIKNSETSTIYAGNFVGEKCREVTDDIVLKFRDNIEDAEAEAIRYKEMKELQGIVIPRFYGLFRVKMRGGYLAGIVLERFGEPIDKLPEDLERDTQALILHYMNRIHKAGILLDDLGPGNIVSDGNDIRIVDFTSTFPHQCLSTYDYLNAPEIVDEDELGSAMKCSDLYSLASEMGFWTTPEVVINGFPYSVEGMPTDPEVIKMLNPGRFFTVYKRYQLITLLKVYYQNVHKKLESGSSAEELQDDMVQLMDEAEAEWTVRCVKRQLILEIEVDFYSPGSPQLDLARERPETLEKTR